MGALLATIAVALFSRANMMGEIYEAIRHAPPLDAQLILDQASAEAWRPVQLSALFGLVVAALLVTPPHKKQHVLGGHAAARVPLTSTTRS